MLKILTHREVLESGVTDTRVVWGGEMVHHRYKGCLGRREGRGITDTGVVWGGGKV